MVEDKNIEQIKDQYKNLYDEDVTIKYDEETGEYLVLDSNGNIISRFKSLDEEIDKLNEEQEKLNNSIVNNTPNVEVDYGAKGRRRIDFSELDINVYYSYMVSVVSSLGSLSSIPSSCNTSYPSTLSGKLKGYYGGLGDDTPSQLGTLAGMISGLAATTGGAISLCQENDDITLKELQELIDEFYYYGDLLNNGDITDDDIYMNDEEFNKLLLSTAFNNESELPEELLLRMINDDENLTQDDKKYLNEQIDKGNVRSCICHLMELNEKQKLELMHEEYDPQIDEKGNLLLTLSNIKQISRDRNLSASEYERYIKGNEELEKIFGNDYDSYSSICGDNPLKSFDLSYNAYSQTINDLRTMKLSLRQQKSLVQQYKHSKEEWEYDYLLKDMNDKYQDDDIDQLFFDNIPNRLHWPWESSQIFNKEGLLVKTGTELENKANKYFDEEHKKLYCYLLKTEGVEAADKYLKAFSDSFNKASGMEKATNAFNMIVDGTNVNYALGLISSDLNGIALGTEDWFNRIEKIFDTTGDYTDTQYAIQYVNQMLQGTNNLIRISKDDLLGFKDSLPSEKYSDLNNKISKGEEVTYADLLYAQGKMKESDYETLKKFQNDSEVMKFADKINDGSSFLGKNKAEWLNTTFNVGVSVGNMLPSMIASLATSGVLVGSGIEAATAGKIGQDVGLSLMFLGCMESAKDESIRDGRSIFDSYIYGGLSGLSEVFTEKFLGYVPGLSNIHRWSELTPTSKTGNIIMKSLLNFLALGPASEIAEEELQKWVIDPAIESLIDGYASTDFNMEEAMELALSTYISTLELSAGSQIMNTAGTINNSNEVISYTLDDGTKINLTYGQLIDCKDKNGKFDINKFNKLTGSNNSTSSLKRFAKMVLLSPLSLTGAAVGGGYYYNSRGYRSKMDIVNNTQNNLIMYQTLHDIECAVNSVLINGGSTYRALVSLYSNQPKRLPNYNMLNRYINRFSNRNFYDINFQEFNFTHISSKNYNTKNITDRLYLNTFSCDDTIQFVTMFADKCERRGIPFYFKTLFMHGGIENIKPFQLSRDESVVIYSDSNNIAEYVNICNEIKRETGINFAHPPVLAGVIDGYIGYGEEPNVYHESYNTLRAKLVQDAVVTTNRRYASIIGYQDANSKYQAAAVTNALDHCSNEEYKGYLKYLFNVIQHKSSDYMVDGNRFFINKR